MQLNYLVIIIAAGIGLLAVFHSELTAIFIYKTAKDPSSRIGAMETLVQNPLIGQFFYQQLIEELVFELKWE